jgi:hypothetical protein
MIQAATNTKYCGDSRIAGAAVVRHKLAINKPLEGGVALHTKLLAQV